MDDATHAELGFRCADMFGALLAITAKIETRIRTFYSRYAEIHSKDPEKIQRAVAFFCSVSPTATRAWAMAKTKMHER